MHPSKLVFSAQRESPATRILTDERIVERISGIGRIEAGVVVEQVVDDERGIELFGELVTHGQVVHHPRLQTVGGSGVRGTAVAIAEQRGVELLVFPAYRATNAAALAVSEQAVTVIDQGIGIELLVFFGKDQCVAEIQAELSCGFGFIEVTQGGVDAGV